MRIGHVRVDGKGLSKLVESLPDMVDGLEVKKMPASEGGMIVVGRAKTEAEGISTGAPLSNSERHVIPVNLSSYLGTAKGEERKRVISQLKDALDQALLAKAEGDRKKAGKVELQVHEATHLGLVSGKPQDLAFAMEVLQALGIKTPAVSTQLSSVDSTTTSMVAQNPVASGPRVGMGQGQRIPMVSGIGMMNPSITSVTGQPLPGTNKLVITQEIQDALKKNQEQIAALEVMIRRLQQELETAKKGAGK